MAPKGARSINKTGCKTSLPKFSTMACNPGVPAATTARAVASASSTWQPNSASTPATNDLPTAIEPVNPTLNILVNGESQMSNFASMILACGAGDQHKAQR